MTNSRDQPAVRHDNALVVQQGGAGHNVVVFRPSDVRDAAVLTTRYQRQAGVHGRRRSQGEVIADGPSGRNRILVSWGHRANEVLADVWRSEATSPPPSG